jgi:sugar phosphate isomerase/epimerase
MCADIKRLAPFAPSGVVALTGGAGGRKDDQARAIVVEGLREVAQAAGEDGIGIGLEPVRYPDGTSLVSTLAETADLIEQVGADNLGIAFDVWHHWDSPTVFADIAAFGHLITSVHIADWRDPPRGRMDRVLPGQGAIDLAGILTALESAGFSGWYELEVFSDGAYEDSILNLSERGMLARAWAGFSEAWAAARLP